MFKYLNTVTEADIFINLLAVLTKAIDMNFTLFLQCLSYSEKKHLLELIQKDLAAPENETLVQFFQRALNEETLSTRLRTIYGNTKDRSKHDDPLNPLHKPVKDITYEDLYIIKGMGEKSWEEFVKLRGY